MPEVDRMVLFRDRLRAVGMSWRALAVGVAMGAVLFALARLPFYVSAPAAALAYAGAVVLLRAVEPAEWRMAWRLTTVRRTTDQRRSERG